VLVKTSVTALFFLIFALPFSASVLQQVENPRSAALGGCYVMLPDNMYAHVNQASISSVSSPTLAISYQNRFVVKELSLLSARFSMPTKWMNVGVSYSFFGFSLYHEMTTGVHVSKTLSPQFSLGAQVDYVSVYLSPEDGTTATFVPQIGMQIKASPTLTIGAHVYNFTFSTLSTAYHHEYLSTYFSAGLGYLIDKKLLVTTQLSKPLREEAILCGGIDYTLMPELILRTGFRSQQYVQPTFGIGLNLDVFQVDLGFQYHPLLGLTLSSGVVYVFGK
jgi:hypothetical protein